MGILRHFLSEHETVEIYQKNSNSTKSCVADFFGSSKSRRRRRHTVRAASSRRRSQQILQDTDTLTLSRCGAIMPPHGGGRKEEGDRTRTMIVVDGDRQIDGTQCFSEFAIAFAFR